MKLIPIKSVIEGKRIVVCGGSIVRGTRLKNQAIEKLWKNGARERHVRIACPPLMFPCPYLLATCTKKELAARKVFEKSQKAKPLILMIFLTRHLRFTGK